MLGRRQVAKLVTAAVAATAVAVGGGVSYASEVAGKTTLDLRIGGGPPTSFSYLAQRPHEAFVPHAAEAGVRQVNQFKVSPVAQGDGTRAPMRFSILTGDLADS